MFLNRRSKRQECMNCRVTCDDSTVDLPAQSLGVQWLHMIESTWSVIKNVIAVNIFSWYMVVTPQKDPKVCCCRHICPLRCSGVLNGEPYPPKVLQGDPTKYILFPSTNLPPKHAWMDATRRTSLGHCPNQTLSLEICHRLWEYKVSPVGVWTSLVLFMYGSFSVLFYTKQSHLGSMADGVVACKSRSNKAASPRMGMKIRKWFPGALLYRTDDS